MDPSTSDGLFTVKFALGSRKSMLPADVWMVNCSAVGTCAVVMTTRPALLRAEMLCVLCGNLRLIDPAELSASMFPLTPMALNPKDSIGRRVCSEIVLRCVDDLGATVTTDRGPD